MAAKERGPLPKFGEVHVRRTLELLQRYRRIGRKRLAEKLGIGEGSVRTILKKLKREGLIRGSHGGHTLTRAGERRLGKPPELLPIDAGPLTVGRCNVATVVRGAAGRVRNGIEQRDEAIKVGADGATVLVFRRGRLQFPDGFADIEKKLSESLIRAFALRDGDVVIIGTAGKLRKAEEGARAAARSLMEGPESTRKVPHS